MLFAWTVMTQILVYTSHYLISSIKMNYFSKLRLFNELPATGKILMIRMSPQKPLQEIWTITLNVFSNQQQVKTNENQVFKLWKLFWWIIIEKILFYFPDMGLFQSQTRTHTVLFFSINVQNQILVNLKRDMCNPIHTISSYCISKPKKPFILDAYLCYLKN